MTGPGTTARTVTVHGQVQGVEGTTPFIRWGNAPAMGIALLLALAVPVLTRRRHPRSAVIGT